MKSKKITDIEFVLENCEYFSVPIERIEYARFGNMRTSMSIGFLCDHVDTHTYADSVLVGFKISPNEIIETEPKFLKQKKTIEEILRRRDITQIHLKNNDDTVEWFFTNWGNGEYTNENQKYLIDPSPCNDAVYLYIGEGSEWDDFVKDKENSAKEYMDRVKTVAHKYAKEYRWTVEQENEICDKYFEILKPVIDIKDDIEKARERRNKDLTSLFSEYGVPKERVKEVISEFNPTLGILL